MDEETISEAHLRTEYGSVRSQVEESLGKQPVLVQRIEGASGQFEQLTVGQSVGEREARLKELATGYDAFQQLQSNITEGTKVSQCTIGVYMCTCVHIYVECVYLCCTRVCG